MIVFCGLQGKIGGKATEDPPNRLIFLSTKLGRRLLDTWQDISPFPLGDVLFLGILKWTYEAY
jgi:hypothetical protein